MSKTELDHGFLQPQRVSSNRSLGSALSELGTPSNLV